MYTCLVWLQKGAYRAPNNTRGEKHTKFFLFLALKKNMSIRDLCDIEKRITCKNAKYLFCVQVIWPQIIDFPFMKAVNVILQTLIFTLLGNSISKDHYKTALKFRELYYPNIVTQVLGKICKKLIKTVPGILLYHYKTALKFRGFFTVQKLHFFIF